ncbi:MAG TPA: enoyl-CoA hydratase-related protein [Candidatus Binataceae bacterium]|nr:enoyl-CoA hydratase-related protein [Candidatus Binataceae bacterium]
MDANKRGVKPDESRDRPNASAAAESPHILSERRGAIGIITIDRREHFNSLDVITAQDLRRAGLRFARDDSVRTVVIRGAGGIFSSGADLKYVRSGGDEGDLDYLKAGAQSQAEGFGDVLKEIVEYIHSTISEIRRAPKPFIAAVDGVAAAGGFGIAMACDLVIASERASFEWAYGRTGLTGAESSTFFLPRLLGLRRAMELVLLSPRLDARRALELGLITAVHPADKFEGEVFALAERLAAGPTRAWAAAKMLINQACGMDGLQAHMDSELESLTRVANGRDFADGLDAFIAKRPPRFRGE